MKLLLSLALAGGTTCAVGQAPNPAPIAPVLPALTLSFGPTTGVDKSLRLFDGFVTTLPQPDVTILDGYHQTEIAVGKSSRSQHRQVAAQGNYLQVRHAINGLEGFDYLAEATDSLQFIYVKSIPLATVTNRKHLRYDYTVENYVKTHIVKVNYSPLAKFFNPMYFHVLTKNPPANLTLTQKIDRTLRLKLSCKQQAYAGASAILRAEDHLLDSLQEQHLLSAKPYAFYKDKVKNLRYILDIETNRMTSEQVQHLAASFQPPAEGQPEAYHHQLLCAIADTYFTEKAPVLDLKDGVNRDYRQVYTQLRASDLFSERDKAYLLAREVNRIGQTFSNTDFRKFFAQLTHDVRDSALVASLRAQYALEFEASRNATTSVVLTDKHGAKLTLHELLKRHAGNVVYVDFWASWCEPCREALPHSRQLRDGLKGKKVVFIYLSIDRTLPPWRAASSKEQLADYPENYLVVNYPAADFFKQHKLTAIPRYMLFDKQGKLLHANAPGAGSAQAANLLTSLAP